MICTRETGWSTITLFLFLQTILIGLLVAYRTEILVPIARATGWVIHTDLIFGGVLLLVVVGGIILGLGGLRPSDVGLIRAHMPRAVVITLAFWVITQIVLAFSALFLSGTLSLHPYWQDPGGVAMLGFLAAMLVGTPLYEEVAFRGYLFPQLFLKLGGSVRRRLWTAALASAVLFALVHIPTRVLIGEITGAALVASLGVLTMAGLFGVVLYLRTENLLVVTGIHALVNAPTTLVEAPISPFLVTLVLSAILWLTWPWLTRALPGAPVTYSSDELDSKRLPIVVEPREIASLRSQ